MRFAKLQQTAIPREWHDIYTSWASSLGGLARGEQESSKRQALPPWITRRPPRLGRAARRINCHHHSGASNIDLYLAPDNATVDRERFFLTLALMHIGAWSPTVEPKNSQPATVPLCKRTMRLI